MTQMTAQVFFVTAQAKDAVQVPITALRSVGAGERRRAPVRKARTPPKGTSAAKVRQGGARGADSTVIPAPFCKRSRDGAGNESGRHYEDREVRVGVMTRVSAQIVSGWSLVSRCDGHPAPKPVAAAKSDKSGAPRMQHA